MCRLVATSHDQPAFLPGIALALSGAGRKEGTRVQGKQQQPRPRAPWTGTSLLLALAVGGCVGKIEFVGSDSESGVAPPAASHWSLIAPARPSVPEVANAEWPR